MTYSESADPAPIERKFGLKVPKPIRRTLVRVNLVASPEGIAAVIEKLNREPGVKLAEVNHVMKKQ